MGEIIIQGFQEAGIKSHLEQEALSNFDIGYKRTFTTKDYDILLGGVTQGVASYNTAAAYLAKTDSGLGYGTFDDPEYVQTFSGLFTLSSTDEYLKSVQKLQTMNADLVPGLALCWQQSLFPYRTDTFQGGVYFPGWGLINSKTWYTVTAN
jgi:peptide/nickel transport system substrate-binding protein